MLRDLNGGSAIMAQEVRTVEQQTPTSQRVPPRPVFLPPTDIYETKESIVVLAEMPGVPPDGLDISLERRVLSADAVLPTSTADASGFTTSMPAAITSAFSHCRKTSTATALRRLSRTVFCSSFCLRPKLPERERSSSRPPERSKFYSCIGAETGTNSSPLLISVRGGYEPRTSWPRISPALLASV